ncbi:replicative helicase loader/inhibitor [Paenibacillus azoreducens]|uniref:replicative helicase loader/inhibitor n=1 Tax=Paenibacillus azoreducens TaxID=116718 RepID=UPI0039F4AC2A
MNRAQVLWILNYLSAAYRSFTIDPDEVEGVVNVWMDLLQDVSFETAQQETRKLCRIKTDFAPTPSEIYQACQQQTRSFYELQRAEEESDRLALAEYNQQAIPMPEQILKRREKLLAERKVNADEY